MTCTELTSATGREPSTLLGWGATLVRRAWHAYWDWRARQVTLHVLRSLDDRTLRDIGVGPAEIESFVYGNQDERTRTYDKNWRGCSGA
jgi:uncharacterized protein YjiS (DUF1127 family)